MTTYFGETGLRELLTLLAKIQFKISVVELLPDEGEEHILYLVPVTDTESQNLYAEYIWTGDAFEKLGTKQIEVDLSDYYTKSETDNLLDEKANAADVYTKDETYNQTEVDSMVSNLVSHEVDIYSISGEAPLTLTGTYTEADHTLTITGSVDAYSKSEIDSTVAELKEDIETATSGGITTITAEGSDELTLSAVKDGTSVAITGSVDLSAYAKTEDIPTAVSELTNDSGYLTEDDFTEITAAEVDALWEEIMNA